MVERSLTTGIGQNRFCVPAGTPDQDSHQCDAGPAPFQGAPASVAAFPAVPPPAYLGRASGAQDFVKSKVGVSTA